MVKRPIHRPGEDGKSGPLTPKEVYDLACRVVRLSRAIGRDQVALTLAKAVYSVAERNNLSQAEATQLVIDSANIFAIARHHTIH